MDYRDQPLCPLHAIGLTQQTVEKTLQDTMGSHQMPTVTIQATMCKLLQQLEKKESMLTCTATELVLPRDTHSVHG